MVSDNPKWNFQWEPGIQQPGKEFAVGDMVNKGVLIVFEDDTNFVKYFDR